MRFPYCNAVVRLAVNYARLRHENTRLRLKVDALLGTQELQASTTRLLAQENDMLRQKITRLSRRDTNGRFTPHSALSDVQKPSLATAPARHSTAQ